MNDGGDCRTAPATRGLLKMVMFTKNDFLVECMAKKVLISWCTEKKKKNLFGEKMRLQNFANMLNCNCDFQMGQCCNNVQCACSAQQ